jgi:hypothetical protein
LCLDPDEIENLYSSRSGGMSPLSGMYGGMPGGMNFAIPGQMYGGMPAGMPGSMYGGAPMMQMMPGAYGPKGMPQGMPQMYGGKGAQVSMSYTASDGTRYDMGVSGPRDKCYAALDYMVKGLYGTMKSDGKGEKSDSGYSGKSGGSYSGKSGKSGASGGGSK